MFVAATRHVPRVLIAALAAMLITVDAEASDDIVLTLIDQDAATAEIAVDRDWLETLPQTEFETSTIWTEGTQRFTGVSLDILLDAAEMTGGVIKATALNDYSVEIPVSDAISGGPIVAHRLNGETMSARDKGPLWIVYPYDARVEYQTEVIYSRSIWQLSRIELVD